MARQDQVTIKMNRKTHAWLAEQKRKTGISIKYLMDKAVALLRKELAND